MDALTDGAWLELLLPGRASSIPCDPSANEVCRTDSPLFQKLSQYTNTLAALTARVSDMPEKIKSLCSPGLQGQIKET